MNTPLGLIFLLLFVGSFLRAQTPAGEITGRVFNAAGGVALRSAVVAVEGTAQKTLTDDEGVYRLAGLPVGAARLTVTYIGFAPQTALITVPAEGRVTRDFELALPRGDEPVQLSAFTVLADREMSAQAVALNERRQAPNLINVVAYDEYGDRSAENVGEFLRFAGVVLLVHGNGGAPDQEGGFQPSMPAHDQP